MTGQISRRIELANGNMILIRPPKAGDARSMTNYMTEILDNSPHLILTPAEYHASPRRTRRWIRHISQSDADLALVALHGKKVIGLIDTATDRRMRVRHITRFGITVASMWRNQGVGKALIQTLLDWATEHAYIEKVLLHVHADNERAHALYMRLGFQEEARLTKAIRYGNGLYVDDIIMAKWVKSVSRHKTVTPAQGVII